MDTYHWSLFKLTKCFIAVITSCYRSYLNAIHVTFREPWFQEQSMQTKFTPMIVTESLSWKVFYSLWFVVMQHGFQMFMANLFHLSLII